MIAQGLFIFFSLNLLILVAFFTIGLADGCDTKGKIKVFLCGAGVYVALSAALYAVIAVLSWLARSL